jgi:hypothetical protein
VNRWRLGYALWGLTLAPCALVLGYIGYRSLETPDLTRLDALFASLQLFSMDGPITLANLPWTLDVARFMAPLAVLYAAVAAVFAVLRDQVERVTVGALARRHVVLIGLGQTNASRTLSLLGARRRAVVIESDSANSRIPGTRAEGAYVLLGDGRQTTILQRARAGRARHVIIATGDDSRNLDVADQVRLLVDTDKRFRTTVHVSIADPALWAQLGRLQLPRSRDESVMEFFNPSDRAAQSLLTEAERIVGVPVLMDVLVDGSGVLAERVLSHLARRALLHGVRARVVLAESLAQELFGSAPPADALGQSCEVVVGISTEPTPATALVCLPTSDAEALTRALALASSPGRESVVLSVQGQQSDGLIESVGAASKLHMVPATQTAGSEFLRHSSIELMARARHEDYVSQELSLGHTAADNPSMVGWEDLPESLKESNRRFAESVGETLDQLGASFTPIQDGDTGQLELLDAEIMEPLAVAEHDRWMSDLMADGWTFSAGPKDPEKKTHPLLVPWDQLDETEREKDRDAIRAIPRMLARAGFAIDLPKAPWTTEQVT